MLDDIEYVFFAQLGDCEKLPREGEVAVLRTKHGVLPVVVFGAPTTALLHAKTLPKSSSLLEHPYHDLVFFFS